MIKILFIRVDGRIPEAIWTELLSSVPAAIREDVHRYHRWQDKQSRLMGKLLLKEWLHSRGEGQCCLERLGTGLFGRPIMEGPIDFNISHSEEYTVCSATDQGRVGVDVEKIRPVRWQEFSTCMASHEREGIATSTDPARAFFRFWTQKECVLKADGRGLLIPMQEAQLHSGEAILQGSRWRVREIAIDRGCICHMASSLKDGPIALTEVTIPDLLQSIG